MIDHHRASFSAEWTLPDIASELEIGPSDATPDKSDAFGAEERLQKGPNKRA
jgi:hypothetical protein